MGIDTSTRVIIRTTEALKRQIPYIAHQGGTSSGKTFGILYSLLFHTLKHLPNNTVGTVVSQTLPHLKKGALGDFRRINSICGLEGQVVENKSDHVFMLPGNKLVEFYAPDDEEKAKSGKRDWLFINEANSVSYSIAKQLIMRTNGPVILDWNPSGKFWFQRMYLPALQPHEYLFTRTTYRDNPAVPQKTIDEIERLRILNPTDYEIYGLGIEGKGTEIIYPEYELVDEFPITDKTARGLDFGFTNDPSAGIRGALYDGCLWWDELFYEKGMTNKMIGERFQLHPDPLGDIIADSAEPKSIFELQGMKLPVRGAVKGPDSVKYWIDKIKEYPNKVTKRSLNLIDEMDSYKWIMVDGRPTNKPKAGNDHLMDAKRYCAQGLLTPKPPGIKPQVQPAKKMGFTNIGI